MEQHHVALPHQHLRRLAPVVAKHLPHYGEVAAVLLLHVGLARQQFVTRIALGNESALVRARLHHQGAVVLVDVDHGEPRGHAVRQVVPVLVQGVLRAFVEVHRLDRLRLVVEAVGERPVQAVVDQELQRERIVEMLIERALAVALLLPEPFELRSPGAQTVHVAGEPPTFLGREDAFENDLSILSIASPLRGRQTVMRTCHEPIP